MNHETPRLLVVEDDDSFRETLTLEFLDRGYDVCGSGNMESYQVIANKDFRFAVVDLKLNGQSGLDLVEQILIHSPRCRIVILTGYGSIATAVKAMRLGAVDYLTKPATVNAIELALKGGEREAVQSQDESLGPSLARVEHEYIEKILAECEGNVSQAARRLGIHRQSLQRKLRKFPLPR